MTWAQNKENTWGGMVCAFQASRFPARGFPVSLQTFKIRVTDKKSLKNVTFSPKNLVVSKKSSNFAPANVYECKRKKDKIRYFKLRYKQ